MIKKGFLAVIRFLFSHVLFRVKYLGLENIQNAGKCVVCPNHSTIFDPFWVYFKSKNMWIMAKAELFKTDIALRGIKAKYNCIIKEFQEEGEKLKLVLDNESDEKQKFTVAMYFLSDEE